MKLSALLITLIVFCVHVCGGEDLYKVLGVRKTASNAEIKKAYKKLAKEWHPDRNRAPEANDKFMKINEAYTTLSDTEKRQHYDNYGTTSAQSDGGPHHGGNPFGAHPFEEFFQQGPFGFQFNFGGGGRRESPFSKFRITLRAYQNNILAESREKPYLIYAYSDFCYHCMEVEMIWDKIVQDATVLGMGIGTVQVQLDHALAGRLRVSSIPALVGIVGGKLRYFGNRYSVNNIREFSRSLLPTDLVTRVTDKNYGEFLNGWRDNRVRALFFGEKSEPTMRYLMAAFQYRENVAPGYVDLSRDDIDEVEGLFRINNGMETLLMFGEAMHNPVATLAMKKLPRSTIDQTMESNKFLALPRLSSQAIFNQLCPPSSQPKRKKLCVVLLTRNNPDYDDSRGTFRKYAQDHVSADERVRYAYIYEDTQAQWVQKLTKGEGIVNETNLKVAVLWRRDTDRLYFDWLEEGWPLNGDDGDLRRSRRKLHQLVDWFIEGSQLMPFTMDKPPELTDENAEHILRRIALKLSDWYEIIVDRLYNMDVVSLMTMFMTVGFVLVIGYMMTTLAGIEEERINSRNTRRPQRPQSRAQATMNTRPSVDAAQRPTLYMHQLHEETFESLVIKSEPGVRLIVMLVDKASKDKLLQTFASIVLPYSRSEAFTFCFLQLEHNLGWLRHLLEETLDFKRDLNNINIKNCIGTVLAINGPRKYYCIYHAQEERVRRQLKAQGYSLGGGFMGFEDSSDEEDSDNASNLDAQKLFESDLMNGLGTWMDRLCEGSLRRFRVEYWPPMST